MNALARRHVHSSFKLTSLAGRSIRAWLSHDAASMGAALSFYTLFSIAPVLLVATWIGGSVLDREAVRQHVLAQMQGLMGEAGAAAVNLFLPGGGSFRIDLQAELAGGKSTQTVEEDMEIVL